MVKRYRVTLTEQERERLDELTRKGTASVRIAGRADEARAGDAIVVPAGPEFELANAGDGPLRLVCCLPVGGQGRLTDGSTFVPPWAE